MWYAFSCQLLFEGHKATLHLCHHSAAQCVAVLCSDKWCLPVCYDNISKFDCSLRHRTSRLYYSENRARRSVLPLMGQSKLCTTLCHVTRLLPKVAGWKKKTHKWITPAKLVRWVGDSSLQCYCILTGGLLHCQKTLISAAVADRKNIFQKFCSTKADLPIDFGLAERTTYWSKIRPVPAKLSEFRSMCLSIIMRSDLPSILVPNLTTSRKEMDLSRWQLDLALSTCPR